MKRIIIALLCLSLASLACSTSIVKPTATPGAGTETQIPAPTPPAVTPTITATARPEFCTVSAGTLNLRSAPAFSGSDVLAWLNKGERVNILPGPPSGEWVKVITADNLTGWINSTYCER